jgi:DNA-binding CsgD family transcriptional regulator
MWENAEVAGLLDRSGVVRVVSRNEDEAPVAQILGRSVQELLEPACRQAFAEAFDRVLQGEVIEMVVAGIADAGYEVQARARLSPAPEKALPVLFHLRRLPKQWAALTEREREVLHSLNECEMNAKRAAKRLHISINTLNAHRRSICHKCQLHGIGEFWIFVQSCR